MNQTDTFTPATRRLPRLLLLRSFLILWACIFSYHAFSQEKKGKPGTTNKAPARTSFTGLYAFKTEDNCVIKLHHPWPDQIKKAQCMKLKGYRCVDDKVTGYAYITLVGKTGDTLLEYVGNTSNGLRNGEGTQYDVCIFGDCLHKLEGNFVNGKLAEGKEYTRDNLVYQGSFDENDERVQGTAYSTDGTTYTGTFKHNIPDGTGEQNCKDGSWYKGGFKAGMRHGSGEARIADGFRLIGKWVNDKPDGFFQIKKWTLGGTMRYEATVTIKDGNFVGEPVVLRDDFSNKGRSSSAPSTSTSSASSQSNENSRKGHSIPGLKKVKFEKKEQSMWDYGEVERWWVDFEDGTNGYMYYSAKKGIWYINRGLNNYNYLTKDKAINAVYLSEKYDEISHDGRE